MSQQQGNKLNFWITIGLVVLAVICIRFFVLMRGFVFLFVLLALIGGMGYFIYQAWQNRQQQKAFEESIEGKIKTQLHQLKTERQKTQAAITEIEENIADLKNKLTQNKSLQEDTIQQTRQLIAGFEKQQKLRQSKLSFYDIAIHKLQTILNNHLLQEELIDKQNTLRDLQDDHHESVADLEELRSNIEYQKKYVEYVDRLSLRMLQTSDPSDAAGLHLELKKITEEIERG